MRFITIDERVARTLQNDGHEFERVHEASLGRNHDLVRDVVQQTLSLLARVPRGPGLGGFLAVDDDRAMVIGTCGFRAGPLSDGTIEIAYFTFPDFEGQGYATQMARGLIELAEKASGVRQVIAHTLPERNPSSRVLEKVGMIFVGEVDDPEDGRVWRWERRPSGEKEQAWPPIPS
jgi:RimJ/RimL family protein N-acetyltransferase